MKRTSTIAVAMSILGVASVANAQSLKFTGTQLSSPDTGTISVNGNNETVAMGALKFNTGSTDIVTYCADALSPLNNSSNPYSVGLVDLSAGTGLALAGKILATNFFSATSADEQAGLQLAIWDALYDNGSTFDASTGNMKVVSGVNAATLGYASSYYTNGANSQPSVAVELFHSNGAGGQSQIHVVPEPASIAVLSMGIFGLIRRRKANNK
jgi:hypothetical protein